MKQFDIRDTETIGEAKAAFQQQFPFLKIEFYTAPHAAGEGSPKQAQIEDHKLIADVKKPNTTGALGVHGNQKVITFEQAMQAHFGLNVQVFRKRGDTWLQTISTDEWTLSEQNERAKESASGDFSY